MGLSTVGDRFSHENSHEAVGSLLGERTNLSG